MLDRIWQRLVHTAIFFARPVLFFYALLWLMCLLVTGTVAERYIGLYQSQKLFFGSFILWIGPVPVPGAYSILSLIAASLIAKLVLKSPLKKQKAGTLLTHASILVLLLGGLITALCREEGYMVLAPDETGHTATDYHEREFSIARNGVVLLSIPYKNVREGMTITNEELPFSIHIKNYCYHCEIEPRKDRLPDLKGAAKKERLVAAPLLDEDEKNESGVTFDVHGADDAQNGTYISYEDDEQQPVITHGKDRYQITMHHAERDLPFSIRLIHFEKTDHPGTDIARSYRSDVAVKDGGLEWEATIEMNQPLRYRGYTLYQSSFVEHDGKLMTVLAVVRNIGAPFPYIAIAVLCIGLLIHIVITLAPPLRRKEVSVR